MAFRKRSHRTDTSIIAPARRVWIFGSLMLSWLLDLSPLAQFDWYPDFLAMTLLYWSIHNPRFFALSLPFFFGILMDVAEGSVLGQHSLAYCLLCLGAVAMQKRLTWLSVSGQILQIIPLFLGMQAIVLVINIWLGGIFPGWVWFLESAANALCWPLWVRILELSQRYVPAKDKNLTA